MKKYRPLLAELDAAGVTATILRAGPRWYEVHVDFEIRKKYKLRRSANAFIVRLHKSKLKPCTNSDS